jgi:hypothetical protein
LPCRKEHHSQSEAPADQVGFFKRIGPEQPFDLRQICAPSKPAALKWNISVVQNLD